jgi:hypothetical protein
VLVAPLEVATTDAGAEVTVMTLVMTLGTQVEMVKVLRIGAGEETAAAVETATGVETAAGEEAAAGVETTAGREVATPPGSETGVLTGQTVVRVWVLTVVTGAVVYGQLVIVGAQEEMVKVSVE